MSRRFGPDDLAVIFGELERVAKMGCYVWDVTGKDAAWSDGMYGLLGLPHRKTNEPVRGESFYELVHPDDRARVRLSHMRIFTEGSAPDVTYRIIRPDGETRIIRGYGTVQRDANGKIARVIGALTDVTATATAEGRLEETDAQLAEIEEAAGVGSHVEHLGSSRRIEWSKTLYRIFGVDPAIEPTIELLDSLVHPDDRARRAEWAARVAQGDAVPPLVIRVVRSDGATRWIETRGRRVEGPTGPRLVGLTLDVTMRMELEERWRQAAKLEAVGTLAAGIAHDFNNYLAVMMLESGSGSQALKTAIQQCASLTNQLVAFARKHPTIGTNIHVASSIATTVELFERLTEPNVKVVVEVREQSVCVVADPGQLDGVLMNLLINARDAMPSGGTVRVRVEAVDIAPSAAELHGCAPGRYAKLSVIDEGVGIAAEHLPRIFEPYFSTKALSRGTGLGLASVYASVKQHRGFLCVESTKGRGSTFEVHLPLVEPIADESQPEPSEREHLSGSVLVVEDMPALRDVAARILGDAGLVVHTAESGDTAIALLRRVGPVDVVLTDIAMPGMGGLELARVLPDIAPRAKVVFMSGYVGADAFGATDVERAIPDGFMIQKPFERAELLRVVAKALAARG
jgi:PAS domain S-box-containing protein